MIKETSKNPELSFEQLQAIDVVQKKLSNLEAEVVIAQKNLVIEKKEVVKATKEREYQEELLNKLNSEIPALGEKKGKLEGSIKEMEGYLLRASEEDKEFKAEHQKIESEQKERENNLRDNESKIDSQLKHIVAEKAEIVVEKEKISRIKEKFSEVLKEINW